MIDGIRIIYPYGLKKGLSSVWAPYRSSPLAGLLNYTPYPHIVAECMFVLVVLLLHGHVWGSIRVHLFMKHLKNDKESSAEKV